ncbi:tetraacyldisaccharide 4'-kinase [Pontibacter locisalis]|uniref:Tetraacyldisaccharide 4'-kinase n=1 Tax=Pontibacter locisalis TaxID=1719035 RepID=A0ABW5IRU4_9BACT
MIKYLKLLLWPFSVLYGGVTAIRNDFYDRGFKVSHRFNLPVIAVGNLTVGGTGKTPHVEYLLRLLRGYKVATLSRGYKRKSKGFVMAGPDATAEVLGDEPYQYHIDFPEVRVAVSEKRVPGIEHLQQLVPELDLIVLDDAMQHRAVSPSLNIMLTDYTRLFYKDLVLPAGLLREPKRGAARADIVIVSKAPSNLKSQEMEVIKRKVHYYAGADKPVFFSTIKYGLPVAAGVKREMGSDVVLLTGIANPEPLREYLRSQKINVVEEFIFPDHHPYTLQDIDKVKVYVEHHNHTSLSIVTTRKDAVKLATGLMREATKSLPLFYLPIEIAFLENGAGFDEIILKHVEEFVHRKHPNQL